MNYSDLQQYVDWLFWACVDILKVWGDWAIFVYCFVYPCHGMGQTVLHGVCFRSVQQMGCLWKTFSFFFSSRNVASHKFLKFWRIKMKVLASVEITKGFDSWIEANHKAWSTQ